jgi:chromosome segregation ATPase
MRNGQAGRGTIEGSLTFGVRTTSTLLSQGVRVQNLHMEPAAIQKLEVGISKWAREELHKAEPIVQEAIIQHVSQANEPVKVTAKEIEELQKAVLSEQQAASDLAEMLEEAQADNEAAAKAHQAQLDKITKLLEQQKAEKEEAQKQARKDRAALKKIEEEIESLKKQASETVTITPQSAEDFAETEGTAKNIVALYERYMLTQAGQMRNTIQRYYEYREYISGTSLNIVDKVMKQIHHVLTDYLDENGDYDQKKHPTINI